MKLSFCKFGVISGLIFGLIFSLVVYGDSFAGGIPDVLSRYGYRQDMLRDYGLSYGTEYYTFSDYRTHAEFDTVTYLVKNGEIIGCFNGDRIQKY